MKKFSIDNYHWRADIDYRKNPEKYLVGKGEQGVLICQPYKSEILPYWRFKTPEEAKECSEKIYDLFLHYLKENDFIGADMARKFLQMGFTRARRYTNYKGGKKYSNSGKCLPRGTGEPRKAISANLFYEKWQAAECHQIYKEMKNAWKEQYG